MNDPIKDMFEANGVKVVDATPSIPRPLVPVEEVKPREEFGVEYRNLGDAYDKLNEVIRRLNILANK